MKIMFVFILSLCKGYDVYKYTAGFLHCNSCNLSYILLIKLIFVINNIRIRAVEGTGYDIICKFAEFVLSVSCVINLLVVFEKDIDR